MNEAKNLLEEARKAFACFDYPSSIVNSNKCIKLSVESVLETLMFSSEESVDKLDDLRKRIDLDKPELCDLARIKMIYHLWHGICALAEQGDPELNLPPVMIFRDREAELALAHARELYYYCLHFIKRIASR